MKIKPHAQLFFGITAVLFVACGPTQTGLAVGSAEGALTGNISTVRPTRDTAAAGTVSVPAMAAGSLYKNVDDTTADEDTTYITGAAGTVSFTYGGGFNPTRAGDGHWVTTVSDGAVSQVTVVTRARCGVSSCNINLKAKVYNGATLLATGPAHALGATYATFTDSFSFTTPPSTVSGLSAQVIVASAGSLSTSTARLTQLYVKPTTACVASRTCSGAKMVYCDAAFGAFGSSGTPSKKIYEVDCVGEYGTGATCGSVNTFSGPAASCLPPGGTPGCTLPCLGPTNLVGCFETRDPPDLNADCKTNGGTYHCGWRTGYGYDCVP